jgi:putative ABC transport system permease protein
MRDTNNPNPTSLEPIAGRRLTLEDAGQPVIVVSNDFLNNLRGIHVGSTLTVDVDGIGYDFEVVGIIPSGNGFNFGQFEIPPGVITTNPDFAFNVLQVEPDNLNNVLLALSENPLVLSLDISFIDSLLSRLINQFSAIPTLVGLLSLLAAAVAMANTVSLATLERRRQIGVLKAIGLKGRRILWIMLLENTLIGLLGGLLGIGLSALGVALMTALGQGAAIPIPRDAMPVAIALVVAAIAIAWAATFLSARPAVSERVTNVLRYE